MHITRIDAWHVSVPLVAPYTLSHLYPIVTAAEAVVVSVTTDDGVVGWGEADPLPPFTADTVAGTIAALRDTLAPALLGADPRETRRNEATMDACVEGCLMAKGALDMAMYDIAAKSYGVPVHALLGGKLRDAILLSFPLGSGTAAQDAEVIDARIGAGFRSFMAKMGRNPIADEIARVHALDQRYGAQIHLVADANQGWNETDAIAFARGVEGTNLCLLEQPVPAAEFESLRRIREHSPVPISADESVVTAEDALGLARLQAVDVLSVKASKNGGITKSLRVLAIAEAAHMRCRMNSMIELGITQAALLHLGAVARDLVPSGHAYMSTLRTTDDITDFRSRLNDGYAHVSDAIGLGVEVSEAKLSRYGRHAFVAG